MKTVGNKTTHFKYTNFLRKEFINFTYTKITQRKTTLHNHSGKCTIINNDNPTSLNNASFTTTL